MKVKIINEPDDQIATTRVNNFLVQMDGVYELDSIIYKPVGGAIGGYNCVMIMYKEIDEIKN